MSDAPNEAPSSATPPPRGGAAPATRSKAQWALLIYGALFLAATLYAFLWQPLRPYPGAEPTAFEQWWYPREENAFLRIPVVDGAVFRDVYAIPSTEHVWVVGHRGLIVHSADAGKTWEQIPLKVSGDSGSAAPVESPAEPAREERPAEAAWEWPSLIEAAHAQEPPLDHGSTEQTNAPRLTPEQEKAAAARDYDSRVQRTAPVLRPAPPSELTVDDATAAQTEPSANVAQQASPPDNSSEAGGEQPTDTASVAQGAAPARPIEPNLVAVYFADQHSGLIEAESGERFASEDGGRTWQPAPVTRQLVKGHTDPRWQVHGAFVRVQRVAGDPWVVVLGSSPLAEHRARLGNWERALSPIAFDDSGFGGTSRAIGHPLDQLLPHLVVIEGRLALFTSNLDVPFIPHGAPLPDALLDSFFETRERGVVSDATGRVFATNDEAATWRPVLYERSVALWYPLVALFLLAFIAASARELTRPLAPASGEPSISNVAASDRPLRVGDADALGLGRIAAGLSEFLRNAATEPPLTVAVTGPWGSGKSSLMGLLKADLERVGYRPVWFNAWHHQKGEHLLASLFANIRAQAIPPLLSPEGVEFRARLLWLRTKARWFIAVILIAAVTSVAAILSDVGLIGWAVDSLGALVGAGEASALDRLASLLGAGSSSAAVVAFGAALWRSLRAFGLDPAKLRNTASAGATDGIEPGARFRFASEFAQVTRALAPRRMVIFIDDLDRCAKEHVVEVLEAVNFLAVSGECFVVLGMEPTWVKGCVALAFDDLANEAIAPEENAAARNKRRAEFAEKYLEKLINIQVRVPTPDEGAARRILQPAPPAPRARLERAREWALPAGLALALVLASIGGFSLLGPRLPKPTPAKPQAPPTETRGELVLAEAGASADGARISLPVRSAAEKLELADGAVIVGEVPLGDAKGTLTLERRRAETGELTENLVEFPLGDGGARLTLRLPEPKGDAAPATASAAQQSVPSGAERDPRLLDTKLDAGIGLLWLPLAAFALGAAAIFVQWVRRPPAVTRDSDTFRAALRTWEPWILRRNTTPRALKRFLNDLRHTAIQMRHRGGADRGAVSESRLVAFASVASVRPDLAREESTYRSLVSNPQRAFELLKAGSSAPAGEWAPLVQSIETAVAQGGSGPSSEEHAAFLAATTGARLT